MIKKIVIEIDEKEIELTLAQAKKLFKDLEQVVDTPARVIERVITTYPAQWIPASTPVRPYTPIWCGSTDNKMQQIGSWLSKASGDTSQS